jgi:hypothetical protein
VTVTLGALAAFDTAGAQSGKQKSQAVAANIAATEIERLRSLRFTDLVTLSTAPVTKTVAGVKYTIRSRTDPVDDPAPSASGCDDASRSPETRRITTSVSWPTETGTRRPVTMTSLVAAPVDANSSRGSVAVQVLNKDGFGVNGLSITVQGLSTVTAVTDANGCARFADLRPATGYRIKFSRAGWMTTPDNRPSVDDPIDIVAGQTLTRSYQYDPAASAKANFYFTTNGAANGTRDEAPQAEVAWRHSNLSGGIQTQVLSPEAFSVTSNPALPASGTPYEIHAGSCPSNQPPTANRTSVSAPGGNVDVRVPTVRVKVTLNGSSAPGAVVVVTNRCSGRKLTLGTTGSNGEVLGGVPYAPTSGGGSGIIACTGMMGYKKDSSVTSVTNYNGVTQITIAATNSNIQSGNC